MQKDFRSFTLCRAAAELWSSELLFRKIMVSTCVNNSRTLSTRLAFIIKCYWSFGAMCTKCTFCCWNSYLYPLNSIFVIQLLDWWKKSSTPWIWNSWFCVGLKFSWFYKEDKNDHIDNKLIWRTKEKSSSRKIQRTTTIFQFSLIACLTFP